MLTKPFILNNIVKSGGDAKGGESGVSQLIYYYQLEVELNFPVQVPQHVIWCKLQLLRGQDKLSPPGGEILTVAPVQQLRVPYY